MLSLTTLPLLLPSRRGWSTLTATVLSLLILLASIQSLIGGTFFLTVAACVLFATLVIWGPLAVRAFGTPSMRRHNATLSVLVDGIALTGVLWIVLAQARQSDAFASLALPLTTASVAIALLVVLFVRYVPVRGLHRAALACLTGSGVAVTAAPAVDALLEKHPFAFASVDLTVWADPTVNGNVAALTAIAFAAAAAVLIGISLAHPAAHHSTPRVG